MTIAYAVGAFLMVMLAGFDVGFAMILAAMTGMAVGAGADLAMAPLTMLSGVDSAALVAVPMFILAGTIMNHGGVTKRLIDWSLVMVGQMHGSLSQVAVVTNLLMAGITGSAVADATATGAALIPAMRADGYKPAYAGAVIAAAAMLGPILPPSIPMVVYAVLANLSVIRLFMAGIVPGLLLAGGYMVICALVARRRGYGARPAAAWSVRLAETRKSVWALAMPLMIIGGIRLGLVTDTEASAVIVVYALIISLVVYRELSWRRLGGLVYAAGRTSAVVLFLFAAAGPFGWLIGESRVGVGIADAIMGFSANRTAVLLLVNLLLLLVGKILEPLPAMVIFLPTLLPIQSQLHIDPIHFAMMVILNLMIGMQTPPIGLLLFVVSAVGKVPMGPMIVEIIPFVLWSLTVLLMVILLPPLATWLPSIGMTR